MQGKNDLIFFCICPARSFASALNVFHLEPSCQVGFVHLSFLSLCSTDPPEGIVDENDFFPSIYNKSSSSYHCAALVFGFAAACVMVPDCVSLN